MRRASPTYAAAARAPGRRRPRTSDAGAERRPPRRSPPRRPRSPPAARRASACVKNPPRHRLDTRSPADCTVFAAASSPASATCSRHSPIAGISCLTHRAAASATLSGLTVAWLSDSRPSTFTYALLQQRGHPADRHVRFGQCPGRRRQLEHLDQVTPGRRFDWPSSMENRGWWPLSQARQRDARLVVLSVGAFEDPAWLSGTELRRERGAAAGERRPPSRACQRAALPAGATGVERRRAARRCSRGRRPRSVRRVAEVVAGGEPDALGGQAASAARPPGAWRRAATARSRRRRRHGPRSTSSRTVAACGLRSRRLPQ